MSQYSSILRDLSADKFAEVVYASSRKAREGYFHRHRIRAPPSRGVQSLSSRKNEVRLEMLQKVFAAGDDEQLAEEILRFYLLLKHRPLLAATLDALNIEHENGLTDSEDVEKIAALSDAEAQTLSHDLYEKQVAQQDDIRLYLRFMGAPLVT